MNLKSFDEKCVRITLTSGEEYEGTVSYQSEEYVFHEYGTHEEALYMTPVLFYRSDISDVVSLENVNGPFGHYSEKYGLLEKKCLDWGTDMIEEILASEDDTAILRMLNCMDDQYQSLAARAVPGMAPWRNKGDIQETHDPESETGPVYLGELENMLGTLVKDSRNEEIVKAAKIVLDRLAEDFS